MLPIEKIINKFVKDLTVAEVVTTYYKDITNHKKVFAYFKKAISNYIKLRLAIMQNEKVIVVERYVTTTAVKLAIDYAATQYNLPITSEQKQKISGFIMTSVYEDVQKLRVDLFTKLLEVTAKDFVKDGNT